MTKEEQKIKEVQKSILNKIDVSRKFKQKIKEATTKISSYKFNQKIILLPLSANSKSLERIDNTTAYKLASIGLAGWASWTIYDAIRDDDIDEVIPKSLATGNILASYIHVEIDIINPSPETKIIIDSILKEMEQANFQEETNSIPSTKKGITQQSIGKSMGMCIPFILYLDAKSSDKTDTKNALEFFYNFIYARQLSDDARDYRDDLKKKRTTLVTHYINSLDRSRGKEKIITEKEFDLLIVPVIARLILKHAQKSIFCAQKIKGFTESTFLTELPSFYEIMAKNILANLGMTNSLS